MLDRYASYEQYLAVNLRRLRNRVFGETATARFAGNVHGVVVQMSNEAFL